MAGDGGEEAAALLRRIAGGDPDAFGRFYDRYAPLVFALALRVVRARGDAEEVLQEVFLQVWRQAERYDPGRGTPEAWITTLARSRAIESLRSLRRRGGNAGFREGAGGHEGRAGGEAEAAEARLTLQAVLPELPAAQREALELAYFEGLTQSEIAERLQEPLGTVKTRMRAGLRRLRAMLGAGGERG